MPTSRVERSVLARSSKFTEADIKRAVKGAIAAGLKIAEVKISCDGGIQILSLDLNTEDTELSKFRRDHGYR
jgi:hypothetical protein